MHCTILCVRFEARACFAVTCVAHMHVSAYFSAPDLACHFCPSYLLSSLATCLCNYWGVIFSWSIGGKGAG